MNVYWEEGSVVSCQLSVVSCQLRLGAWALGSFGVGAWGLGALVLDFVLRSQPHHASHLHYRIIPAMNWHDNIITTTEQIRALLANTRTIAVLGIKTESQAGQPAYYVPSYLQSAGFDIIPVPVFYPEVTEILGQRVYRSLAEIPGEVDLVNVFRRSQDVAAHVPDILARNPKAVWLQSGISDNAVAQTLATANIKVVQDRCLMVDHRYLGR